MRDRPSRIVAWAAGAATGLLGGGVLLLFCGLVSAAADGRRPAPAVPAGLEACANGGFMLPGSRTCLRLGGAVRAEASVSSGGIARRGASRLGTDSRVDLDLRTPSELGEVRVFTSIRRRQGVDGPDR